MVQCCQDICLSVQLRITEIENIAAEVVQLPAVTRVNAQLAAHSGDIHAIKYNLAEWDGGSDLYTYCSLGTRSPAYKGTCTAAMATGTPTGNAAAPFTCLAFPNGTTLAGADCTAQVDLQGDCTAICKCVTGDIQLGTSAVSCSATKCVPLMHVCRALQANRLSSTTS
jgi:hypothetical protein